MNPAALGHGPIELGWSKLEPRFALAPPARPLMRPGPSSDGRFAPHILRGLRAEVAPLETARPLTFRAPEAT